MTKMDAFQAVIYEAVDDINAKYRRDISYLEDEIRVLKNDVYDLEGQVRQLQDQREQADLLGRC